MHRSGTSLVASILAEADIKPPPDLLPAHPVDNSGGYFESREVVRINNSFLVALDRSWSEPEPLSGALLCRFRGNSCPRGDQGLSRTMQARERRTPAEGPTPLPLDAALVTRVEVAL